MAAAPETATAGAKQEVKADAASSVAAIPASSFYAGKSSAANGVQAKKAALSAGSMAASGALQVVEQAGAFHDVGMFTLPMGNLPVELSCWPL